jgi:hypothetical protein
MTSPGIKLFGVNGSNQLVWRETNEHGEKWKVIQSLDEKENGKTLQVKHLTSIEGVLFLINDGTYTGYDGAGRLLARFATTTPLAPSTVGHAIKVNGLASLSGALYSVSSYLGRRAPVFHNENWVDLKVPNLAGIQGMTATREHLIAFKGDELWKWKPGMKSWEQLVDSDSDKISRSSAFVAIAAVGDDDDIYAIIKVVGAAHELWVRKNGTGEWKKHGKIDPVRTMTAAMAMDLPTTLNDVAELQVATV